MTRRRITKISEASDTVIAITKAAIYIVLLFELLLVSMLTALAVYMLSMRTTIYRIQYANVLAKWQRWI